MKAVSKPSTNVHPINGPHANDVQAMLDKLDTPEAVQWFAERSVEEWHEDEEQIYSVLSLAEQQADMQGHRIARALRMLTERLESTKNRDVMLAAIRKLGEMARKS